MGMEIGMVVKVAQPICTKHAGTVKVLTNGEVHICTAVMSDKQREKFEKRTIHKFKRGELVRIASLDIKNQAIVVEERE